MKRTQIYLDEELDQRLREVAAEEGRSAADLIREAVRMLLSARRRTPELSDPILQIAGSFTGGPGDAATEHDRYLYGKRAAGKRRA